MVRYSKELSNKNRIQYDTSCEATYSKEADAPVFKWVFSGKEECTIGNRTLAVYPENFIALNKGTRYVEKIDSMTPVSTFSVSFSTDFIEDFNRSSQAGTEKLLENPSGDSVMPGFLEAIYPFSGDMRFNIMHLKAHLDKGTADELLINEYLHHCLISYYKLYNKEVLDKIERLSFAKSKTRQEVVKRLTLAKDFIISNYDRNFSLEEVAQNACLSVNHLLRTFKEAFSISPHQYLMEVRLRRSKFLLRTTSYHIHEIVNLVGFECPSSFIRLFKNRFKITPVKYRCRHIN